ncbi:unnamed protein product [Parascedosporium putredinis]|uniref:Dynactin subunit 4 n=1 Tax=Parascedosporium putredinis TaxID=1442378 RepID=A0A9P1MCN8_9PEZI|nr:unnamed protein product [Parascedosporium putredinis]CAI8001027.1 unnamed protein product [Parascedosporium putredinis]
MASAAPYTYIQSAESGEDGLYPLEHLMYCGDCQQIRCQRCVNEEIVTYYCPSCLFEVPSSNIKSEGNRRSVIPTTKYVLTCTYCHWSSSEIDIRFEKSSGLYSQLVKIRNGGQHKLSPREYRDRRKEDRDAPPLLDAELDADLQFAHLKSFYQTQLADANSAATGSLPGLGDLGFSSPGTLSRIMSLYTGGSLGGKRSMTKSTIMREALTTDDGLKLAQLDESAAVDKLLGSTWYDSVSTDQRDAQPPSTGSLGSQDDLRPIPTLLRTKRSKRCPVCRHIITKPDAKVTSTRYRINLTAQFILTFKNPIFEEVKVTLGTPPRTPGRFPSKVTVLCPQFTIGANTDMWEDALKDDYKDPSKRHTMAGSSGVPTTDPATAWLDGLKWAKSEGEDVDDSP